MEVVKKSNREKATALDAKIYGVEPKFNTMMSKMELINALNFYNSFDRKDLMKSVNTYMKNAKYDPLDIEAFKSCEDWMMSISLAKVAALINKNGASNIPDGYETQLKEAISQCVRRGFMKMTQKTNDDGVPVVKQNPQLNIINRAHAIMGEIDNMIDERNYTFDVYTYLKEQEASAPVAKEIVGYYGKLQEELNDVKEKTDPQLVEGYKNYSRTELNKMIGLVQSIIDSANKFIHNTKALKVLKPRKKKVKSADQLTSKVQYCKSSTELKLVSISPTEIIGSASVWIYNTKYKKLGVYIASPNQTLSVKGTTIINFSEELSVCKTLRKPELALTEFMKCGKVALRKFLDSQTGKPSGLNGRINNDTILLKAVK